MRYIKMKLPTQVKFATEAGVVKSLEGDVAYQLGDALMTGVKGERWSISRARFEATYVPLLPTKMGEIGSYLKKPIVVEAEKMVKPFEIMVHGGKSMLKGKPGDWLVTSPDGTQWVVEDSIFVATYKLADA